MSSLGTELKINVHVEPIDGYHMEDYDLSIMVQRHYFFYTKDSKILELFIIIVYLCSSFGRRRRVFLQPSGRNYSLYELVNSYYCRAM